MITDYDLTGYLIQGYTIVKACLSKEERYKKAEEFKEDLKSFLLTLSVEKYDRNVIPPSADGVGEEDEKIAFPTGMPIQGETMILDAQYSTGTNPAQQSMGTGAGGVVSDTYGKKPKKKKWKAVVAIALALPLIAAATAGYLYISRKLDPLNKFQDAIAKNDYEAAAELYREELKTAIGEIEEAYIGKLVSEAGANASSAADYADALEKLHAAAAKYPDSTELRTAIAGTESSYLNKALEEADAIAEGSGYADAVAALNAALRVLPDNASIKTAIVEYEAKYPILLQQMTYFTGNDLTNGGQEMDNMQEMQENIILLTNSSSSYFDNTYKLEGKYKRITGSLYQPFDRRSDTHVRKLEIFGDGRLLYSAEMSGGKEPVEFDVDLTGVSDLEIRFLGKSYNSEGYVRLANVELHQ